MTERALEYLLISGSYAEELARRHGSGPLAVLEVGCNDGVLLRQLPFHPRREWRRAEPEEPVALGREALGKPRRSLLHAAVLGQPPRELLGRFLGLQLVELQRLVGEKPSRLQLEQPGEQDEELAARVEVELIAFSEPLDERHHDAGHVDLGRVELLLQQQRQEQVERTLEGIEVQVEVVYRREH